MSNNIAVDKQTFVSEMNALREKVPGMPYNPYRALSAYGDGMQTNQLLKEAASKDIAGISASLGHSITSETYDKDTMQIMAQNQAMTNLMSRSRNPQGMSRTGSVRKSSQDARWNQGYTPKTSMLGGGGSAMGGDVYNAIPRFYDPLEYWDISGLPWNVADEGHRHKLHKWLRLYYATHYLVPVLVDIFTRFPLVGMHLESPDPALTAIYEDLFLDQLKYEDFLVALGREFWLVGEAFPLGSFDEDLGVWEHEELINPEDVVIDNFPLLDSQQLKIVPPDYLRRIAQTKSPAREWYMLQQNYSDLIPYLLKGEHIPISPVMLTQVANKLNDWDDHGTPILLRGLRTLLHEEKLLASQDAIAERLYSPFILAKLGIMDMGDQLPPWIPTPDELNAVRDDIDIAMASDFRVMVHHFGLEMTSVFGREQMPRLGDDFDRIERRLMEVFGVNPSLLSAGSNSQPYASSALQAEFMNQMLRTFQKVLKDHFKFRASVVAEAQGHYAYERKGNSRIPIYENVVSYDDDGDKVITKEHKLLVPTLNMECLALGSRISTPMGPVATETLKVGDNVWGWDVANDRAILAKVSHSYDNGLQTTYEVHTKSGRNIRATAEHPFLTQRGWVEASKLHEDDKIRVGTQLPTFEQTISERDARFIGLMVGDGCLSQCDNGGVPMLANTDVEVLQWANHYASGYGCSLKAKDGEVAHDITQNDQRVNPNPIKAFLREQGLIGHTAHTKRIPSSIWSGGSYVISAFLSGYLDADGSVVTDKCVKWYSCNESLMKDCQDLLASINVRSQLVQVAERGKGKEFVLIVSSRAGLNTLQKVLDPLCERKQLISTNIQAIDKRRALSPNQAAEIKEIVANPISPSYKELGLSYGISSSTIWRAIHGEYDDLITTWVDPSWDEIDDIQLHPAEPTWSLGISGDHTHITEGLITHNTFDLRDEATERQFLMGLRAAGLPIPDDKLMIGVTWKDDDYITQYNRDIMKKTISQQRAKMDTYIALVIQGLPVPMDLKYEVESVLQGGTGPAMGGMPGDQGAGAGAGGGMAPPPGGPPPGGGGPESDFGAQMPPPPGALGPGPGTAPPGGGAPPMAPGGPAGGGTNMPQISNERRPGLTYNTSVQNDSYTEAWVNHASREILISVDDLHDQAELRHQVEGEYPDYTIDIETNAGAPSDGGWMPISLQGGYLAHIASWPEEMQNRATVIQASMDKYGWFHESPEDDEPKISAILDNEDPNDPSTWILRVNQKIAKHNGENIIVESNKKRLSLPVEPLKKYSIIDTSYDGEYDRLKNEELNESTESESA